MDAYTASKLWAGSWDLHVGYGWHMAIDVDNNMKNIPIVCYKQ